jgi:hypothetical protein
MCGGSPKADPVLPPPPEKIPELVLDEPGRKKSKAKRSQQQLRAGRGSLVTPGLTIGGGGSSAPAAGSLGRPRGPGRRNK